MSAGEERRREVLENRKTFRRLNKEILQGIRQQETVTVATRSGEECEVTLHPVTEVRLLEIAEKHNLSLDDIKAGKASSKLRFMEELVADAIVESPNLRLTPEGIDEVLDLKGISQLFTIVVNLVGLTVKTQADVEKFRPEPPGPSA